MRVRTAIFTLCLPVFASASLACGTRTRPEVEVPAPPPAVEDLGDFEQAYNEFVLLPEGTPAREAYRTVLMGYLLHYIDRALQDQDEEEALSGLQYALSLYTPAELRKAPAEPALARRAGEIYAVAARRGAEDPSLLALAVQQRFAEAKQRKGAVADWELVERWLLRNGPYATEPLLRHEELERSLEQVAAVFPSPFVVERLADLYVARYGLARQARLQGRSASSAALRRMEITGYLLMRLYLRADDFDGALAAMDRVELDVPVAKLREMMVDAIKPRRSALPLLALAEQFVPEPDADPEQSYVVQGWGIVDNLSRRAIGKFDDDPYAHLLRARALSHSMLTSAAIVHLRSAIDRKEDIFEAWQALAELEQRRLESLSEGDPLAAAAHLPEVEALHRRAFELWSDRPIQPGLPRALYTVAEGLYHAGEVDRAQKLLQRSLGIEPVPNTLDLLGTIALKRDQLAQASARYEDLANLAYENEVAQLQWEARARAQLAEIAARRGDATASNRQVKMALRHTNDLLAAQTDDIGARADRYVERGKLLFMLGDLELAMDDFHKAAELTPKNVKVWADPLRYTVAHGYYDESRKIFRRAMAQGSLSDSLKLYFSLWLREMALRQGHPPEPEAVRFLETYQGGRWGELLAAHAKGEVTFENLIAGARDRGEKAEAYFYEGLRRWRTGEAEEAKRLMRRVLETDMMGFFEYEMAQSYLDWGEIPQSARTPLAAAGAKALR